MPSCQWAHSACVLRWVDQSFWSREAHPREEDEEQAGYLDQAVGQPHRPSCL